MNRREFLKALGIIAIAQVTDILSKTENLNDEEFVTYVVFQVNMLVSYPSKNFRITNIEVPLNGTIKEAQIKSD